VASLYHYFPSKADLLRAVLEERRYGERLSTEAPPIDPSLPPRERLVGLMSWLWVSALEEEAVFRLLVGEGIRGEEAATATSAEVVEALGVTIEAWLADGFPELAGNRAALARVIRGQVFALVVEHLAVGGISLPTAQARAEELAAVLFP
jgi:AcrR family transcriptional regulator